jgi:hypothetical protein
VLTLHRADLFDVSVIHDDGTPTAAKKGGDNIGFNGHKKIKGDKVVAFCDRNCNVIAPFISSPGNYNESPLLRGALPVVTRIADSIGVDLRGTIVNLDGVGTAANLGVKRQSRLARIRRSLGKTSVRSRNRVCHCRRGNEPEVGGPRRVVTTACAEICGIMAQPPPTGAFRLI